MIFFHSFHNFIVMNGLGGYVWGSYIICTVGILVFLSISLIKRNRIIKKSQNIQEEFIDEIS